MFFRLFIFVSILVLSSSQSFSQDVLAKRIMIYNKIVEQRIELDSARLFYNLKFAPDNNVYIQRNTEIIQHRKEAAINTSFFWLLLFLFIFSMVRYSSGKKYSDLISDFLSFKIRDGNSYRFLKSILVILVFVVLFSYFIVELLVFNSTANPSNKNFSYILASIMIIMIYRYVLYYIVVSIFNLKNNISNFQFIVFDFMYIFVFISLPILFFITIVNSILVKPILIVLSAVTILLYIFAFYKIIILNIHLLTRYVFKTLIYLYVVEIIPILLFLKYLKLL